MLLALGGLLGACGSQSRGSGSGSRQAVHDGQRANEVDLDPTAIAKERAKVAGKAPKADGGAHAQVVVAVPPGQASEQESLKPSHRSQVNRAEEDAQIRRDLAEFRKFLATIPPAAGDRAEVTPEGQAAVPFDAPPVVQKVVQAANEIAKTPYRWGGGHGDWRDTGYDCSGSVSFALAAAGLLDGPLTSGQFMTWGAAGPGKWITLWANGGHVFMEIAGIRYDTGGLHTPTRTRWQPTMRSTAGFTPRHPPGL